jgi:hypothetical protein
MQVGTPDGTTDPPCMSLLRRLALCAGLGIAACAAPSAASAQQLAFEHRTWGSDVEFSYRFRDASRREHALSFRVPERDIEEAMGSFRSFSLGALYQHMDAAVAEAGRKAGVQVRITMAANGSRSADLRGPSDAVRQLNGLLPTIAEEARVEYLKQHLRRNEGNFIHVDYAAAVRQAIPVLRPLAQALRRQAADLPERALVQHALTFFQTIPYDDLTNLGRYGGVDFAPSAAMLKINAGDCDSKAVAMAAVLRQLQPARRLIIVRMPPRRLDPGHAILMADLPAEPGDATLQYRGQVYVALEATGPALAPVGAVDERAAEHLDRPRELVVVEIGR